MRLALSLPPRSKRLRRSNIIVQRRRQRRRRVIYITNRIPLLSAPSFGWNDLPTCPVQDAVVPPQGPSKVPREGCVTPRTYNLNSTRIVLKSNPLYMHLPQHFWKILLLFSPIFSRVTDKLVYLTFSQIAYHLHVLYLCYRNSAKGKKPHREGKVAMTYVRNLLFADVGPVWLVSVPKTQDCRK